MVLATRCLVAVGCTFVGTCVTRVLVVQAIYSVSRNNLNDELLKSLEACDNVEIVFGAKVKKVSPDGAVVLLLHTARR